MGGEGEKGEKRRQRICNQGGGEKFSWWAKGVGWLQHQMRKLRIGGCTKWIMQLYTYMYYIDLVSTAENSPKQPLKNWITKFVGIYYILLLNMYLAELVDL